MHCPNQLRTAIAATLTLAAILLVAPSVDARDDVRRDIAARDRDGTTSGPDHGRRTRCDFTGNGVDDLAVGVPGDGHGTGMVNVQYHGDGWLDVADQIRLGVEIEPAQIGPHARFGAALACGDFNGDGVADLAIAAPGDLHGGRVFVRYGVKGQGLTGPTHVYSQLDHKIPGFPVGTGYDGFGHALAAGDFDGDGADDLAIGAPRDANDEMTAIIGSVIVLPGRLGQIGLDLDAPQRLRGWVSAGMSLEDSEFGFSLAVGNFAGTVRDGLVVGAPGAEVRAPKPGCPGCTVRAGAVYAFRPHGGQLVGQFVRIRPDAANGQGDHGERFGHAVAIGDLDGDGNDDLVVGAPMQGADSTGGVHLFPGDGAGVGLPTSLGPAQLGSYSLSGDWFGFSVAVGDFDGDGYDDLAVGAPRRQIGAVRRAGAVFTVPGAASVLVDTSAANFLHADLPAVSVAGSSAQEDGYFGASLTVLGLLEGGPYAGADLIVGAPGELGPVSTIPGTSGRHAGSIHIMPGFNGGTYPFAPCNPCVGIEEVSILVHQDTTSPFTVANERGYSWSVAPQMLSHTNPTGEWFGWAVAS